MQPLALSACLVHAASFVRTFCGQLYLLVTWAQCSSVPRSAAMSLVGQSHFRFRCQRTLAARLTLTVPSTAHRCTPRRHRVCDSTRCRRIAGSQYELATDTRHRVDTNGSSDHRSRIGSPATVASCSLFSGCATRHGAVESWARQEPSTDTGLRTTVWRHNAAAAATGRRSGCTAPVAASGSLFATAALRPVGGILSVASCRHSPTPKVA